MKPINQTKIALLTAGLEVALFSGCATEKDLSQITPQPFGKTLDGTPVQIYTLRNAAGMNARIMTYGGIVQSLDVPNKKGNFGLIDGLHNFRFLFSPIFVITFTPSAPGGGRSYGLSSRRRRRRRRQ